MALNSQFQDVISHAELTGEHVKTLRELGGLNHQGRDLFEEIKTVGVLLVSHTTCTRVGLSKAALSVCLWIRLLTCPVNQDLWGHTIGFVCLSIYLSPQYRKSLLKVTLNQEKNPLCTCTCTCTRQRPKQFYSPHVSSSFLFKIGIDCHFNAVNNSDMVESY